MEKVIGSSDLAFQHPTLGFYDQRRRTGDKVSRSKSVNGVRLSKWTIDKNRIPSHPRSQRRKKRKRVGDPVYIFRVVWHTQHRVSRTTTRVSLSLSAFLFSRIQTPSPLMIWHITTTTKTTTNKKKKKKNKDSWETCDSSISSSFFFLTVSCWEIIFFTYPRVTIYTFAFDFWNSGSSFLPQKLLKKKKKWKLVSKEIEISYSKKKRTGFKWFHW